jgi:cobalt-precorrin-5B (C1)-methyltransferase
MPVGKKLRSGITTGSCAAAAAKASTIALLSGRAPSMVTIRTPGGIELDLPVAELKVESGNVSCAVKKDSGDDPDITDGMFIYATVSKTGLGPITIEGGKGIGRVTKPGLACGIGEAAINPVPRAMIISEVREACRQLNYEGGLHIEITAPEGEIIAKKTFNSRLGIVGGISILGTTGIVEPMSKKAWTDTVYLEMKQQVALGNKDLIICPGNYGEDFIDKILGIKLSSVVKCSNFIGETLDFAEELELKSLLLIGHVGKLVKLGAGIMNTHSKVADARMEVLAVHAAMCGASKEKVCRIMDCNTTEEATLVLREEGICEEVFRGIMNKIDFYVHNRVGGKLQTAVLLFSNEQGILGKTRHADELIQLHRDIAPHV